MLLLLFLDSHGGAAKPPTVGSHLYAVLLGPRAILITKNVWISEAQNKILFKLEQ